MIKFNGNNINKWLKGTSQVNKVYKGEVSCYPDITNNAPTPPTPPTPSYDTEYLTFVATESGTFTFTPQDSNVIYYSTDSGSTWTEGNSVSVSAGDKVLWKGTMTQLTNGVGTFDSTNAFTVEGNVMSLLYGDEFVGQVDLTGKVNVFNSLFYYCKTITSAENMILPATTLSQSCYLNMFNGCIKLTTAPTLPATTLTTYCYAYMFGGCRRLNSITCLATTHSTTDTIFWVSNVSSTGTFYKHPNATWSNGNNGIPNGWTVEDYTPPTPHDYSQDYLTFVATESGTFTFTPQNSNVISYSLDSGSTWTEGNSVNVSVNDKVLWKGTMTPVSNYLGIGTFSSTNPFTVEGNPMSLLYGDNFVGLRSLTGYNRAFGNLFSGCTSLTSAENLSLPATTLAQGCYQYMFFGCSGLTTAPELPATTLADDCYSSMFQGCSSLTTAPQLLTTTLAVGCYYSMFRDCTSLVTAPVLSATTLIDSCYGQMFYGCSSLTTAPQLPATTLVYGCYSQMFRDCTSLVTAPTLSAATLVDSCYAYMFQGCSSLSAVTTLATDISATRCTYRWLRNVPPTGTFTKAASMTSWTSGESGIPSGWTVQDYQG